MPFESVRDTRIKLDQGKGLELLKQNLPRACKASITKPLSGASGRFFQLSDLAAVDLRWNIFQEDPRFRSISRIKWAQFQNVSVEPNSSRNGARTLKVLESRSLHKPQADCWTLCYQMRPRYWQANCSHTMVLTKGRCKVRMLLASQSLRVDVTNSPLGNSLGFMVELHHVS